MFEGFFEKIFGPLMSMPEPFPIFVISLILTIITTVIYKYATDQELMKTLKQDVKALQAEMKQHKDNQTKVMEINKVAMQKNMQMMKQSFKPMIFTLVPVIFIFGWLRQHYTALGNPDVFFGIGWLWTYIIFSVVLSIGLRKLLKVA